MDKEIITRASSKIGRKKKIRKWLRLIFIFLFLLLLMSYVVVGFIYSEGNFSITLDKNLYFEKGLIIYDDADYKVYRSELLAETLETFDNIHYRWLPDDLDKYSGSHNGENYVAYSFYIENTGTQTADYWSEIVIDEVIKNLDEAIRIRLYKNGKYVTYAKLGSNGKAEKDSVPFASDESVVLQHEENFEPGDINKYTVVLWLEGTDQECTDNILGGEIKIHMEFNSEYVEN